jgi:transposase InsO family protein
MLGLPHATISAVLQRHGLSRLRDVDRATGVPIRYVREHPGELIHLDTKHLGCIPPGGGHRQLGRAVAPDHRRHNMGYEVLHVAVDDASRLAFVQLLPDDRGPTAARFLLAAAAFFAEHGIRIQRVMTDRAFTYTVARAFRQAIGTLRVRHKITRPYHPQTNGKAERFIQTLLAEWAYVRLYRSNEERHRALPKWLRHYNQSRPHTALGGQCPVAACKQRP